MKSSKLRIGMIGLGGIAQKVYLPFLAQEMNWSFVGAYSRTKTSRETICSSYRVNAFTSIEELLECCDAVFIASSTESHFDIASTALQKGKDIYIDKPLAATLEQAEKLAELAVKTGRKTMVGFNRRFAPMYVQAKKQAEQIGWIRIEKHRADDIKPVNFIDTLLDDYIHMVDTARWLGKTLSYQGGWIKRNQENHLLYASHAYHNGSIPIYTQMHRKAGSNLEQLEFVTEDSIIRVKNLDSIETEKDGKLTITTAASWDTIIKRRGFTDTILHFIDSVLGDTKPAVDAEEGFKTQKLLYDIIAN